MRRMVYFYSATSRRSRGAMWSIFTPALISGGELEQIQFLLGHVSVQTTERYLGCKQRIRGAVNDHIGIEPEPSSDA